MIVYHHREEGSGSFPNSYVHHNIYNSIIYHYLIVDLELKPVDDCHFVITVLKNTLSYVNMTSAITRLYSTLLQSVTVNVICHKRPCLTSQDDIIICQEAMPSVILRVYKSVIIEI